MNDHKDILSLTHPLSPHCSPRLTTVALPLFFLSTRSSIRSGSLCLWLLKPPHLKSSSTPTARQLHSSQCIQPSPFSTIKRMSLNLTTTMPFFSVCSDYSCLFYINVLSVSTVRIRKIYSLDPPSLPICLLLVIKTPTKPPAAENKQPPIRDQPPTSEIQTFPIAGLRLLLCGRCSPQRYKHEPSPRQYKGSNGVP